MGDMSKEPSMEEILSSIKRIIAEEGEEAVRGAAPRPPRRGSAGAPAFAGDDMIGELPPGDISPEAEEVLELTDEIAPEEAIPPIAGPAPEKAAARTKAAIRPAAAPAARPAEPIIAPPVAPETILSVESEVAARHSLSALSSMVVKPAEGGDNTLEALVRSMLRPMLKEWLDAQLPEMVEAMVAKEIARITGRA